MIIFVFEKPKMQFAEQKSGIDFGAVKKLS